MTKKQFMDYLQNLCDKYWTDYYFSGKMSDFMKYNNVKTLLLVNYIGDRDALHD